MLVAVGTFASQFINDSESEEGSAVSIRTSGSGLIYDHTAAGRRKDGVSRKSRRKDSNRTWMFVYMNSGNFREREPIIKLRGAPEREIELKIWSR